MNTTIPLKGVGDVWLLPINLTNIIEVGQTFGVRWTTCIDKSAYQIL